jgi:hypothetical protein
MGVIQETLPVAAAVYKNPVQMMFAVPGAIALGGIAKGTFAIVHQSEMGIRTRSGNPLLKKEYRGFLPDELEEIEQAEREEGTFTGHYDIRGLGLVWKPRFFVDNVIKVSIADQFSALNTFDIESKNDGIHKIEPTVTWSVRPDGDYPYLARYRIRHEKDNKEPEKDEELTKMVKTICSDGIGRILRGRTAEELIEHDRVEVTGEAQKQCEDQLLFYGVELHNVWFNPVVRSSEERLAQSIETTKDPIGGTAVARGARGRLN